MKVPRMMIVLSLLAFAGCNPGESGHLRACQAELARKENLISLLRAEIQTTATTMKARSIAGDTELFAREARIKDLQRQLDYATTQIVRGEAQSRDFIENQRKSFQEKVEGLQERIAELEKKLAEKS
ncbi:MAG TPA: hypothetical protein VMU54_14660 [Planctomycetota bacterium]|nr:hypothetical protein [Planctomycetota bacterium]